MTAAACTIGHARRVGAVAWRSPLRRFGPVLVAAVVVAAILRKYRAGDIAASLREGDALRAMPIACLLAVSFLTWGAMADMVVLRRFGAVGFLDVARGKAAAAVLTAIGYFFSNGGYGVWIARRTQIGASLSAGLVLYFMMGDLAAVGVVASAVMPWVHGVPHALSFVAVAIAALPVLAIALGPLVPAGRLRMLDPWRAVPRSAGFLQLALRCVNVGIAALLTSLAARAFGLSIPFGTLVACTPILVLVSSLPVNVAGIGAAQAAWLLFFLPFEEGTRILAFQLAWTVTLGAAMVLRGLPFVPRALGQIAAKPTR
jgi:hypothetical protein